MTARLARLAAAAVVAVGVVVPAALAALALAPASAQAAAAGCSTSAGCATVHTKCSGSCPTVRVTPASDIATDQWVTVDLSGYHRGDDVTIFYCSIKRALTAAHPSPCVLSGTPELQYPGQQVPIGSDGKGTAAVNVEADPPGGGDKPIQGEVPGANSKATPFFCDNGPNRCAVEVVDSSLSPSSSEAPNPSTTAVVPLRFLPSSNGCPGADLVTTSSDYSIETLLPQLVAGTCAASHPAIALDTANDLRQAADGLASGNDQVLFTTDPQAPDIKAVLAKSHHTFVDVPLVASADVVAISASQEQSSGAQVIYPDNDYRLTPNMVAGLATYNYSSPSNGDLVDCPDGSGTCSGIELLNQSSGYISASQYGGFDSSAHTGVTDQLLAWLCKAPTLPYDVGGSQVNDPNDARTTLTTSTYDSSWPIKSCTPKDQLPSIVSPSSTNFALLSDPSQQAKYLHAFAPPPAAQSGPVLGVAPMDWSQANFYGFSAAALQNAAGQFVAPSTASIETALQAASAHGGIVTPDYSKAVAGAYPMPTVVYAVVRTGSGAAKADNGVRSLLSELSSRIRSGPLPDGYAPLPSSLSTVAAKVIKALPASQTAHTGGKHGHSGGTPSGGQTSTQTGGGTSAPKTTLPPLTQPSASSGSQPQSVKVATPPVTVAARPAAASNTTVDSTAARYGVPALIALVLLAGSGSVGLRLGRRWLR